MELDQVECLEPLIEPTLSGSTTESVKEPVNESNDNNNSVSSNLPSSSQGNNDVVKPKQQSKKSKKNDGLPDAKTLKAYIVDNKLQKEFKEYSGKCYNKSNKDVLMKFIDAHKLELSMSSQSSNSSQNDDKHNEPDELVGKLNKEDDDIIETIAFQPQHNESNDKVPEYMNPIKLNRTQHKIKLYIDNFPVKLKSITSRPGFAKEFAQIKEVYVDPQTNEEYECPLLVDVERALGCANVVGIIESKALMTIQWIEDFCDAVRRHKSVSEGGKIPDMVKNTIGNLRLQGWHEALDKDQNFHDCVKELLIKYGGNIEELLGCLSVETRLCMILLFHAYTTHKGNTFADNNLKNRNVSEMPDKFNKL